MVWDVGDGEGEHVSLCGISVCLNSIYKHLFPWTFVTLKSILVAGLGMLWLCRM